MKPWIPPPLHVVTDDAVVARADFLRRAVRVVEAGGPLLMLHLRGPRTPARRLYEAARALRDPLYGADGWLVVNDRVDVALAARADGVQLGAHGLHPADARRLLGPDDVVGASVHAVDEAGAAREGGADFVVAGTIWETATHPGRPGAGTGLIRAVAALGIPTIAIGGVTAARAAQARDAGAAGVAVLRGVWDAPDPAAAVSEYLKRWKG